MVLRFRVGTIIVEEMRRAIKQSVEHDRKYRNSHEYKQWNRPTTIVPACDDPALELETRPLQLDGFAEFMCASGATAAGEAAGANAGKSAAGAASAAFLGVPTGAEPGRYQDVVH